MSLEIIITEIKCVYGTEPETDEVYFSYIIKADEKVFLGYTGIEYGLGEGIKRETLSTIFKSKDDETREVSLRLFMWESDNSTREIKSIFTPATQRRYIEKINSGKEFTQEDILKGAPENIDDGRYGKEDAGIPFEELATNISKQLDRLKNWYLDTDDCLSLEGREKRFLEYRFLKTETGWQIEGFGINRCQVDFNDDKTFEIPVGGNVIMPHYSFKLRVLTGGK